MFFKAIELNADNYAALITEYCFNPVTVEDYKMEFEMNAEVDILTYMSISDFPGHREGEQYNVYLHYSLYGHDLFENTAELTTTEFKDTRLV